MPQVAILVPGIMGSVLELDGEVIWPGPVTSLVSSYKKMKELLRPELVPSDCIRRYLVTDQYQRLIDDLATCGFHEHDQTLIVAAYDWRKDNAESAETLARHVDAARAAHGEQTEVSIIAHSMGGLVGRYYCESGHFAGRPGFSHVRRLITLGTPHRGAALALPLVLGYEKRLFLDKDQVLQLCCDTRYPAPYQLLPLPSEPFAWSGAAGSRLDHVDVFEPTVAGKLGLVAANLAAARAFHVALDVRRRPAHVRYFCFAGTRQTTATHVLLRSKGAGRLEPVKIEQEDGGDGTVPTWGSFLEGFQKLFVGGEHGTIYGNRDLRRALATLLGKEGSLRGVPEEVEVALREKVVEPQDQVHATVGFRAGIQDFSGVLTIERAQIDSESGRVLAFAAPVQVHPVEYKGVGLETLSLVFEAPNLRGVYRVAFRDELEAEPAGYDELIVQEPPRE